MGIKETRKAIENLVSKRGYRAVRIWGLASGYHPEIDPAYAISGLKMHLELFSAEFRQEAQELIKDIENVLRNPPLP